MSRPKHRSPGRFPEGKVWFPGSQSGRYFLEFCTFWGASKRWPGSSQMTGWSLMPPNRNSHKEKYRISVRNLRLLILWKSRGELFFPFWDALLHWLGSLSVFQTRSFAIKYTFKKPAVPEGPRKEKPIAGPCESAGLACCVKGCGSRKRRGLCEAILCNHGDSDFADAG